jgi:glycerate kinase
VLVERQDHHGKAAAAEVLAAARRLDLPAVVVGGPLSPNMRTIHQTGRIAHAARLVIPLLVSDRE